MERDFFVKNASFCEKSHYPYKLDLCQVNANLNRSVIKLSMVFKKKSLSENEKKKIFTKITIFFHMIFNGPEKKWESRKLFRHFNKNYMIKNREDIKRHMIQLYEKGLLAYDGEYYFTLPKNWKSIEYFMKVENELSISKALLKGTQKSRESFLNRLSITLGLQEYEKFASYLKIRILLLQLRGGKKQSRLAELKLYHALEFLEDAIQTKSQLDRLESDISSLKDREIARPIENTQLLEGINRDTDKKAQMIMAQKAELLQRYINDMQNYLKDEEISRGTKHLIKSVLNNILLPEMEMAGLVLTSEEVKKPAL